MDERPLSCSKLSWTFLMTEVWGLAETIGFKKPEMEQLMNKTKVED